jgi:hypothetical protein
LPPQPAILFTQLDLIYRLKGLVAEQGAPWSTKILRKTPVRRRFKWIYGLYVIDIMQRRRQIP